MSITGNKEFTVLDAYKSGIKKMQDDHNAEEVKKLGILRAGNSGLLIANQGNKLIGPCARQVYLRFKGIKTETIEDSKEHMFAAGRGNEDIWALTFAKGWPHKLLRETEVPTSWVTKNDTKVTGRPDMVLLDAEDKPVLGLELKLVSSVWTARDKLFQGEPSLEHICQATHYSWQTGIPFQIWYASRVDWPVVGWMQKNFPKDGEPGSEYCEYNNKGEIKKVRCFLVGYELRVDPKDKTDFVYYRQIREDRTTGPWIRSIVSVERIEDYYNYLSHLEQSNELPAEPENQTATGEKMNWKKSGYCSLSDTGLCCAEYASGPNKLDKWFSKLLSQYIGTVPTKPE